MATGRQRIGGLLRRQSMRVYNEPFTPNVEERDENEAHVLLFQLPDFRKDHVKVNVDKEARTVVVTADRNVGTNRLLILDKTYTIPQNCVIDQINHKLEDGILTITMPKQTIEPVAAPAVEAPEQTTAPPPPPSPPKQSESVTAPAVEEAKQTAAPLTPPLPPKEVTAPAVEAAKQTAAPLTQPLPPKEVTAPAVEAAKQTAAPLTPPLPPKEVTAPAVEAAKQTAAPLPPPSPPKESEQSTPKNGRKEMSPEKAPPETKPKIKGPEAAAPPKNDSNSVKPTEEDKGKSAELQKQASGKGKEEAAMPAPAEKGQVQGDSGEEKMTPNQKISSPDQKPTEKKKEIENQNPEKGKESKTEEVGKKEEPAEIGIGTPSPRVAEVMKLSGDFKVGRVLLPLTAATVIAVAAYFTYVLITDFR